MILSLRKSLLLGIICIFPIIGLKSAKILFVAPIASKSEAYWYGSVAKELLYRGHELIYVTASPITVNDSKKTLTQIVPVTPVELHKIFRPHTEDLIKLRKISKSVINEIYSYSDDFIVNDCHKTYQNAQFIKEVLNKSRSDFDLIIFPGFVHQCFYGLVHKYQIPFIITSTISPVPWIAAGTGSWLPPSFVPFPILLGNVSILDFSQRILNFVLFGLMGALERYVRQPKYTEIYKEYLGSHYPSSSEIEKNVSLILANTHFAINYPYPSIYPSIIEIGGFNCQPGKDLPKELENFLEKADHGFIYFSLGTFAKSSYMPKNVKQIFIKVFSRLKQKVLWKVENSADIDANLPSNVMQMKWFPQNDVLGHPKIKCVIIQGGIFSIQESIYNGVPVLGIPIALDQDANINELVKKGIAISLEILDLTEDSLEGSLRLILENPSYSIQAKKISVLFRDQPQSPVSLAMYWIDYIIKHKGAQHIFSPARNLNFFQYFSLDVISLFLVLSLMLSAISLKVLMVTMKLLSNFRNSAKVSKLKKLN